MVSGSEDRCRDTGVYSEPDGSRDKVLRLRDIICPAFEQDHSVAGQGGQAGEQGY